MGLGILKNKITQQTTILRINRFLNKKKLIKATTNSVVVRGLRKM